LPVRALWVLPLLLATAVAGGCELEECDPDAGECDPNPEVRDAQTGTIYQTYRYVLVRDQHQNSPTGTAGVDIDAVSLTRGGGRIYFADTWHEYIAGPGVQQGSMSRDPNQALGPPGGDAGACISGGGSSVMLGGTGGSIVVSFGGEMEIAEGDLIRVITCDGGPDEFGIFIGGEPKASSPRWVTCSASATGTPECPVPPLPGSPDGS
jgi:hypothetical protein